MYHPCPARSRRAWQSDPSDILKCARVTGAQQLSKCVRVREFLGQGCRRSGMSAFNESRLACFLIERWNHADVCRSDAPMRLVVCQCLSPSEGVPPGRDVCAPAAGKPRADRVPIQPRSPWTFRTTLSFWTWSRLHPAECIGYCTMSSQQSHKEHGADNLGIVVVRTTQVPRQHAGAGRAYTQRDGGGVGQTPSCRV